MSRADVTCSICGCEPHNEWCPRARSDAHRRALADVNGDPPPRGLVDLVSLALFIIGVVLIVAIATEHVIVEVSFK